MLLCACLAIQQEKDGKHIWLFVVNYFLEKCKISIIKLSNCNFNGGSDWQGFDLTLNYNYKCIIILFVRFLHLSSLLEMVIVGKLKVMKFTGGSITNLDRQIVHLYHTLNYQLMFIFLLYFVLLGTPPPIIDLGCI